MATGDIFVSDEVDTFLFSALDIFTTDDSMMDDGNGERRILHRARLNSNCVLRVELKVRGTERIVKELPQINPGGDLRR